MGGKETKQVDSQYYEEISFEVNILVCIMNSFLEKI